ncbi:uncharacterized protein LOC120270099 isoform X1 [Dioscorea cayenensis subsp. rotundata]|uniref:Uncharacterized protein LOC120270099 isoform X1 n=1 Tax=Dioscorea cayennensis subsp. rotundata TaxID=55577 RepID=A0AB40BZZ3_DIOCR|nr:uncharacterized protein LOC120270099 isoform X1 [Dioscorea cayenensis subsp. rotundata]
MATDGFPAHGVWTTEEDKILREGLERHRMKATLAACKEIAAALPRKTIVDVAMRCEWLLVAGKITSLLEYHVSRPVGHMSSDGINTDRDIGEVRRNLLDSTSNILKGVGENPQVIINEMFFIVHCSHGIVENAHEPGFRTIPRRFRTIAWVCARLDSWFVYFVKKVMVQGWPPVLSWRRRIGPWKQ